MAAALVASTSTGPLAEDCATGVVRLDDGRVAYADETTIRVLVQP